MQMAFFIFIFVAALLGSNCIAQELELSPEEAKAAFAKADRALNDAWAAARKSLPEGEFEELVDDQRAWVEYRDYMAQSPMYTGISGQDDVKRDTPEYFSAAANLSEMRTEWLKALANETNDALTGTWTDSYGGRIEVVEQSGKLYFAAECVRGPTSHLGQLSGVADWNERIGWFSDKGHTEGKDTETNLSFILRGKRMEIIGANTGYYHGARAYFDGKYVKVAELDYKSRAGVIKAAKEGDMIKGE
ncbi:MAG: DUF1311 domain-containing protein [Verrucomicrobiae bacterium]|nr:DUF1311 domain-containing protein [Verrucomicrobiae bacterium]